jgi:hypothetical protein
MTRMFYKRCDSILYAFIDYVSVDAAAIEQCRFQGNDNIKYRAKQHQY